MRFVNVNVILGSRNWRHHSEQTDLLYREMLADTNSPIDEHNALCKKTACSKKSPFGWCLANNENSRDFVGILSWIHCCSQGMRASLYRRRLIFCVWCLTSSWIYFCSLKLAFNSKTDFPVNLSSTSLSFSFHNRTVSQQYCRLNIGHHLNYGCCWWTDRAWTTSSIIFSCNFLSIRWQQQ
jgi:hypothetical protein